MTANGDLLEEILTLDDTSDASQSSEEQDSGPSLNTANTTEDVQRQKPGPVPLTEQFPDIVQHLTEFLRDNGFRAQVYHSVIFATSVQP